MIPSPPGESGGGAGPARPRLKPRPHRVPVRIPSVLAVLLACWLTGLLVVNLRSSDSLAGDAVRRAFPMVGGSSVDQATVDAAWATVRSQYWRRDVNPESATQGAVAGIVDQLRSSFSDRFSSFFTRDQYRDLQSSLSGHRAGSVGIELEARCDGGAVCATAVTPTTVTITGVLLGQPAEHAGVRRGDVLVKIGGRPLTDFGPDPTAQIDKGGDSIRGAAGTQVVLTVRRGGQMLDVTVTRADLTLPSVYARRFGSTVDIQVTAFDERTGDDVRTALQQAFGAGVSAVVLDLRHNPGGLVTEAQAVASQFLTPSGTERDVVVRRGRINGADPSSAQKVERDTIASGGLAPTQRLAVLVDSDSASAAEIVAAALQDYHRATVVGTTTFGKGSVQEDFGLPDGSDLHLTVEKWFGPAGESIDGKGIAPDRPVTLSSEDSRFRLDVEAPDSAQDTQLQAALAAVAQ